MSITFAQSPLPTCSKAACSTNKPGVWWQQQWLLSEGLLLVRERGLMRGPGEVLAFVPHPALTGRIDWSSVMPISAVVWTSISAQPLDGGGPSAP